MNSLGFLTGSKASSISYRIVRIWSTSIRYWDGPGGRFIRAFCQLFDHAPDKLAVSALGPLEAPNYHIMKELAPQSTGVRRHTVVPIRLRDGCIEFLEDTVDTVRHGNHVSVDNLGIEVSNDDREEAYLGDGFVCANHARDGRRVVPHVGGPSALANGVDSPPHTRLKPIEHASALTRTSGCKRLPMLSQMARSGLVSESAMRKEMAYQWSPYLENWIFRDKRKAAGIKGKLRTISHRECWEARLCPRWPGSAERSHSAP